MCSGRGDSAKSATKRVRVSDVDKEIPAELPSPSPLPPITSLEGGDGEMKAPSVDFTDDEGDGKWREVGGNGKWGEEILKENSFDQSGEKFSKV